MALSLELFADAECGLPAVIAAPAVPAVASAVSAAAAAAPISAPIAAALFEDPPELLPLQAHPALWRAHELARPLAQVLPSRFVALDVHLPGGGWPLRALTELLLPHPGVGELRLLAPVLAALQGQQRSVMWFDPPAAPCAWALAALGLDMRQLVVVHAKQAAVGGLQTGRAGRVQGQARNKLPAADILWALEQALKSGHVGAVVAWLPARLPADALRRLQLAAQAHDGPAFLLRSDAERQRASAAPLRLLLGSAGPDALRVQLLKRRGPPLLRPVVLQLPPVLSHAALLRAQRVAGLASPASAASAASGLTPILFE